ncbi:MAG: hypothetical protein BIFFINMI_01777 [Phycisphaerae bacterium]|nr:hypothetical protein [Phycisphaerae bacterium]
MKRFQLLAVVLGVVILSAGAAQAAVTIAYDGSFNAASGYYPRAMAFLPNGVGNGDRPASVTGPTILTVGGHGSTDYIREFYIPALVTSGVPNNATQVTTGAGGTFVDNTAVLGSAGGWSSLEVMGGYLWGLRGVDQTTTNFGVGLVKMGSNEVWASGSTGVSRTQGWTVSPGSTYTGAGVANKWDETNTLVTTDWNYLNNGGDLGYTVYVTKQVQGAPTGDPNVFNWTSSNVFRFVVDDPDDNYATTPGIRHMSMEYLQVGSTKYYVLSNWNDQAGSSKLMFFNAATATGLVAGPDFTLDIKGYIEGGTDGIGTDGVGWWQNTGVVSFIRDLSYDDATNTLYVLDATTSGGSAASRIHVFTLSDDAVVPEPATLALLALGGIGMIGGAARRRRRD